MSFSMFQLEKSQALDLLTRVTARLDEQWEEDGSEEAMAVLGKIIDGLDCKMTEVDEEMVSMRDVAVLLHSIDLSNGRHGNALEYGARWYGNSSPITPWAFKLAAGRPLEKSDLLLHEDFIHGAPVGGETGEKACECDIPY
jgi:hypothetical protein